MSQSLADLPTIRAYIARMRIKTDMVRALLDDTCSALESGRADTMLRVLESKAAAGEMATEVTELAMRVCGGHRDGSHYGRALRLHRQGRLWAAPVLASPSLWHERAAMWPFIRVGSARGGHEGLTWNHCAGRLAHPCT